MAPTSEDPRSDAALIRLVRRGTPEHRREAFDVLVVRHQGWLGRLLYSLLGSQAAAEDVLQETFVRVFLASDKLPDAVGLRAWLRTIATRTAFNHRRDSTTRRRYADAYAEVAPAVNAAEPSVISREVLELVLSEMSYPMREVLVLRYIEELSVPEIAEALDLGLSAAKMRLSRARTEFLAIHGRFVRPADQEF